VAEEFCAPDPWVSVSGFLRFNEQGAAILEGELNLIIAVPCCCFRIVAAGGENGEKTEGNDGRHFHRNGSDGKRGAGGQAIEGTRGALPYLALTRDSVLRCEAAR
jgi:hypothetical protein